MSSKLVCLCAFGFTIVCTSAFADVTCTTYFVTENQLSNKCVEFTVPENGAVSGSQNCGNYTATVDCDAHNNHLSITITGPNHNQQGMNGTLIPANVELIDTNGNGLAVHCIPQ